VTSNGLRKVGFLYNQLIPKPQLGNVVNEILTLKRGYHETINWWTNGIVNA
jgi:hypothetical protein